MAIKIDFDSSHNVIPPTLVLSTRNGEKLGGIIYHNLVVKDAIRNSMEMSFSVNKNDYTEERHNAGLWQALTDFKLVWAKEWDNFFEIAVTTDEDETTEKEITAVSLGEAELSQINLYNIEINTEDDIARDDYEPTVLYNINNHNASLLHRITEKIPHYTIAYVDSSIKNIQRTFTFDSKSIYDAFQEIAEEMECVFEIKCRSDGNHGIQRNIYVYDLKNYGNDTNILLTTDALANNISYSVDTGSVKNCFRLEAGDDLMTATVRNCNPNGSGYIWYISDELKADMSDELVTKLDKYNELYKYFQNYYNPFDSDIKNLSGKSLVKRLLEYYGNGGNVNLTLRPLIDSSELIKAGWDDEEGYTATVFTNTFSNYDETIAVNFTPIVADSSGKYIKTLSPAAMSEYAESVIEGYREDDLCLQIGSPFTGRNAIDNAVNAAEIIHELQDYYYLGDNDEEYIDLDIVAISENYINTQSSVLNSYNQLIQKYNKYSSDYTEISSPLIGYPQIMEVYYNTIDFYYYLNNSLMPTVKISDTDATKEATKLSFQSLKDTAVQNLSKTTSVATVSSAILSMAKAIVDTRYQVKIVDESASFNYSEAASTWKGDIKVTNYSNEDDTYTISLRGIIISSDYSNFIKQKLKVALANTRTDTIADIGDLFDLDDNKFKNELKKYSLQRLKAFHDACQGCIDVLLQQGVADSNNTESSMYKEIYLPYFSKLGYIQAEMDVRQKEIDIVKGKYDSNGGLLEEGMQTILESERDIIQGNLNFQDYLGESLWNEFAAYRREDTYSNSNYISDGLGNAELFDRAMEFIQTAKDEIEKSATLQHTIDAQLKNLLVMKEFAPIINNFQVGNWLRLKVDDRLFKLRLVDYKIDFENLTSIDVSFSDVVIDGSEGNIKNILSQASSMATTYNSVSRQARRGDKSASMLNDWVDEGLSLTQTKIIDNADNQEVSWDKHGLVCREYDSVTDTYSDKQVKLINKGVYVTDNGWRTAKAGIGNFTFFNPAANNGEGEWQEAYGVIADTLVGNLILGKNVGIYNTANSITMDENGFTLTTNGTNNDEPQSVFTIRRKTLSNGNKNFIEMLRIDSDGYLTINGNAVNIQINNNEQENTTLVNMVDGKITTQITDNNEMISSQITQTANEIKSTVSSSMDKYDISKFNFTISLFGFGEPDSNVYDPSAYSDKYYLDQSTGDIYYSVGDYWDDTIYKAELISEELSTEINERADGIEIKVASRLYGTSNMKIDEAALNVTSNSIVGRVSQNETDISNRYTKTETDSQISQSAGEIKSTVSKSTSKYDITGYTITLYGYGTPASNSYVASGYNEKYYLDQNNGRLYLSNGSSWNYVKTLELITDKLSSQITQTDSQIRSDISETYETKADANTKKTNLESSISQTATQIKSTVSSAMDKYDTSGYTVTLYGYGTPANNDYTASNYNGKYYLDQNNGRLYLSNGSSWSNTKTLQLVTENLKTQIAQNATDITSKVSSGDFGTLIQQNADNVKIAWNNISKYISFENAALNIYTSTSQGDSNLLMKLNNSGSWFYKDGSTIGKIGTNTFDDDSIKGLVFDLETQAKYMAWAYRESGASAYNVKLIYFPNDTTIPNNGRFYAKGFHFKDSVYLNSNTLSLNDYVDIRSNDSGAASIYSDSKAIDIQSCGSEISVSSMITLEASSDLGIHCYSDLNMNNNTIENANVTTSSDSRFKTNIVDTSINAIELLNQIDLKEFDWIESGEHTNIGIIAQQLQEVIPELVYSNPKDGRLSIKSDRFIPYLIKAIQELILYLSKDNNIPKSSGAAPTSSKKAWKDNIPLADKKEFIDRNKVKKEIYKPATPTTLIIPE